MVDGLCDGVVTLRERFVMSLRCGGFSLAMGVHACLTLNKEG